jgi:hypothetical protein
MASRTGQERQERPSSLDGEHRSPGPAHRRAQAAGPLGRLIRVPPALAPGLRPLHRPVHRDPGPDCRGLGVTRAWLGGRRHVAHVARERAAAARRRTAARRGPVEPGWQARQPRLGRGPDQHRAEGAAVSPRPRVWGGSGAPLPCCPTGAGHGSGHTATGAGSRRPRGPPRRLRTPSGGASGRTWSTR